jgi:hypothetical protein
MTLKMQRFMPASLYALTHIDSRQEVLKKNFLALVAKALLGTTLVDLEKTAESLNVKKTDPAWKHMVKYLEQIKLTLPK